jgi:hemerythrin superfamily protein
MPNGLDLILADHRAVEELFTRFDQSGHAALVAQAIDMLKAHDEAERAALYPFAAELLGDTTSVDEMLAEHHSVREQIVAVSALEGEALVAGFAELRSIVDHHVAEEEKSLLPVLRKAASQQQLEALGARFLQAKQRGG